MGGGPRREAEPAAFTLVARRARGRSGYDGKHDRRWVLLPVVDYVVRDERILLIVVVPPGVQVSFEVWKIAARHLDANAVARQEGVARSQRAELHLVHLTRLHEHRMIPAVAPTYTLDALVEIVGFAVGIHVDELDRQVGVLAVRGEIEGHGDGAGDLHRTCERRRR